jgi:hypothetical protein
VRKKGCPAHGRPPEAYPVRKKGCSAHGKPPEPIPCAKRAVPRTASRPKPSRAQKGRFCARQLARQADQAELRG